MSDFRRGGVADVENVRLEVRPEKDGKKFLTFELNFWHSKFIFSDIRSSTKFLTFEVQSDIRTSADFFLTFEVVSNAYPLSTPLVNKGARARAGGPGLGGYRTVAFLGISRSTQTPVEVRQMWVGTYKILTDSFLTIRWGALAGTSNQLAMADTRCCSAAQCSWSAASGAARAARSTAAVGLCILIFGFLPNVII